MIHMVQTTLSRNLKVIQNEIDKYNRKERNSVFEIGKRFKHVKENILKHGEYTKWIKKIGYTPGTAQKYVKVYERFGNIEEASNIRVSALFEMLSLKKSINIKEFINNAHEVNGELKTVEHMKKRELRDLIKATNGAAAPSKASPATHINKDSSELEAILKKVRTLKSENSELMEYVYEHLDSNVQRVLDLAPNQKAELLACCRDDSYRQDLAVILNLLENELDHIEIKEYFLSKKRKAKKRIS